MTTARLVVIVAASVGNQVAEKREICIMSKNISKKASAKPAAPVGAEAVIAAATKKLSEKAAPFAGLIFHKCIISDKAGGKHKDNRGKTVNVTGVYTNMRFGTVSAKFNFPGHDTDHWINPAMLTASEKMAANEIVAIAAAADAEFKRTVIVPARLVGEREKALCFKVMGYETPSWFGKAQCKVLSEDADDLRAKYIEVPAWMLRKSIGQPALDMADAKQDEYTEAAAG